MPNDQSPNPLARIAELRYDPLTGTYYAKNLLQPDEQVQCASLDQALTQLAAWAAARAAQPVVDGGPAPARPAA